MKHAPHEQPDFLTPAQICEHLDKYVIGQTHAKRVVAIAAYNHQKRILNKRAGQPNPIKKSNVLFIGPTGCGKTHIARNLATVLDLPFTVVDATEYTEAGYYGKDVEVMVAELLFKTGGRVDETQRGIIFIDVIDKTPRLALVPFDIILAEPSHPVKDGFGRRALSWKPDHGSTLLAMT